MRTTLTHVPASCLSVCQLCSALHARSDGWLLINSFMWLWLCGVLCNLRLIAALRAEKGADGTLELQLVALFHPDDANSTVSVEALDAAIVQ